MFRCPQRRQYGPVEYIMVMVCSAVCTFNVGCGEQARANTQDTPVLVLIKSDGGVAGGFSVVVGWRHGRGSETNRRVTCRVRWSVPLWGRLHSSLLGRKQAIVFVCRVFRYYLLPNVGRLPRLVLGPCCILFKFSDDVSLSFVFCCPSNPEGLL